MTRRWMRRLTVLGLAVLLVSVVAVLILSHVNLKRYGSGQGLDGPVDAILVLGGGIDGDGVLGYSSRRRVRVAVDLLREGTAQALILSGGGVSGSHSAGRLMADFAISIGADPASLVVDGDAGSTFENLRFGFAIAERNGWSRLALLTDAFHVERAKWLAAYFGRPEVGLVAVDGLRYDSDPHRVWSIMREAMAWWYNLIKVAAWEALGAAGVESGERGAIIR